MADPMRPVDHWTWVAWLDDGSTVREADERGWADVPSDRVTAIELVPVTDGRAPLVLAVPPGATATLFRHRQIRLDVAGGRQWHDGSVTVVAWAMDGRAVWVHLQDDGRMVVADRPLPPG